MNFERIKPVENFQFYIDLAMRRAREKGSELRAKKLRGGSLEKSKYIELMKMNVFADTVSSRMENIVKSFPSFEGLPEFYRELIKLRIDYGQVRKSLAAVDWAMRKSREMLSMYADKINKNREFERINVLRNSFLGRASSILKQIKRDLIILEDARKSLKNLPDIDTALKTTVISGFPNIGKTTLMYRLTGSKGDIQSYPFTTKGINVAYLRKGNEKMQILDTPGTLNRFNKMNDIEKVAYLAIKYCASIIVYVFDLTGEYPMMDQINLYKRIKADFEKDMIVYFSKKDIVSKKELEKFEKEYNGISDDSLLKAELLQRL
ncbi:50S ribosome-binding GTPase [Candidatus Woesearchaeota archaeon]|nr:50S ribosome-binding GTPase [Candidatus Woesearchaeota archaeon]